MYTYEYPRPALTVDSIVLHKELNTWKILLIQRANPPYQGKWAFPGGFVDMDEELVVAAQRELQEETGLELDELKQFRTYGGVNRDPRGRTVSVVYYAIIEGQLPQVLGGDDAAIALWFDLKELPNLAFDHQGIIEDLQKHLGVNE